MRRLTAALPLLALLGCSVFAPREQAPAVRVLYPQVSRVEGDVWVLPRYARESRKIREAILLEPGDRVETGRLGKAEISLPQATVRLYEQTKIRVPYAFEDRTAIARQVEVEEGEALVRAPASPFAVTTIALHVDLESPATVLVGFRDKLHQAVCYQGTSQAHNIRVRGQTVVRLTAGHRLSLDDGAALAYLQEGKLPDEWHRWELAGATSSGLLAPASSLPAAAAPLPPSSARP